MVGDQPKLAAFRRARVALVASGTATLELALAGVPMAVAYKVSRVEELAKYLIDVPSIVLANLVLGENVVPEFLQRDCEPGKLTDALGPLFTGGAGARRAALGFCAHRRLADAGQRRAPERRGRAKCAGGRRTAMIGRDHDLAFRLATYSILPMGQVKSEAGPICSRAFPSAP